MTRKHTYQIPSFSFELMGNDVVFGAVRLKQNCMN
jgi:hypothetical protein